MATTQTAKKTIAFVLYPELTPLDLVGPLQVLTSLSAIEPRFRVVVVAERIAPLASDIEVPLIADKTFAEVPRPDIIFVPGGVTGTLRAMRDETLLRYVRDAAESAEIVASVCTGSLILASAGLLRGRPSTTHWVAPGVLENFGARYHRKRWVEDGKLIMAAGVSAGIDMALHLVDRLTDRETARRVQLAIEYDPQPPFGGIDWQRLGLMPRIVRAVVSLAAPLMTRRPKRIARQAGWS
ncbi:MAG TPA: DJ-1/PfpI family protein [Thermomicrobiaceae bacterium]|nr:DJ-1/PfpI family protein [Thermomicrobiaceae bacterium]